MEPADEPTSSTAAAAVMDTDRDAGVSMLSVAGDVALDEGALLRTLLTTTTAALSHTLLHTGYCSVHAAH
jgi:hypothetical protein